MENKTPIYKVGTRGRIIIENAQMFYKNFAGRASEYNHVGDRNFCVYIDDPDFAQMLNEEGWNVKIRKPKNDPDADARNFIKVNVSYKFSGPKVFLHTGNNVVRLDDEIVCNNDPNKNLLDTGYFTTCDMIISPSRWEKGGRAGVSGYLEELHVVEEENYFANKYGNGTTEDFGY